MPSCEQLDVNHPSELANDLDALERIERDTLDKIVGALEEYKDIAALAFDAAEDIYPHHIFQDPGSAAYSRAIGDVARAIGEDVTEMALDSEGIISRNVPLSGRTDHKMVRTIQHPNDPSRQYGQALMIDSKAEKEGGTSTIQRGQTSMDIKFKNTRKNKEYDETGDLPKVINSPGGPLLSTTILIKYKYSGDHVDQFNLDELIISCLPHGYLQGRYNKDVDDSKMWRVGRDSPKYDENFRVRVRYDGLKSKSKWRVREINPRQSKLP